MPPFIPDYEKVKAVAALFPTNKEMGAVLGCSETTIDRLKRNDEKFRDAIEESQSKRKMKLRQVQWKKAIGGNVTMMIWLGKQHLGQTDKQDISNPDGTLTPVGDTPDLSKLSKEELEILAKVDNK